jgi:hypothetical protein
MCDMFIGISVHTYINIYIYTVFLIKNVNDLKVVAAFGGWSELNPRT